MEPAMFFVESGDHGKFTDLSPTIQQLCTLATFHSSSAWHLVLCSTGLELLPPRKYLKDFISCYDKSVIWCDSYQLVVRKTPFFYFFAFFLGGGMGIFDWWITKKLRTR